MSKQIEAALQKADTTHQIIIGPGVLSRVAPVFRKEFGDSPALIIADENTFQAAGKSVQERLQAADIPIQGMLIFPAAPTLHADYAHVSQVREFLREHAGAAIAVGSGTINDLTKLASYQLERKYMVVATAASMDGYTSFGASITHDGFKMNDHCDAPAAVLADLDVLAAAPPEMNAWGYADLMGKVTAGADWIIADALGVEAIDAEVWSMVQTPLLEWLKDAHLLQRRDHTTLANLFEGLTISGLAMQFHRTSRPASGSEHQFSHLWEMLDIRKPDGSEASHGAKVGIGTLASSALYQQFMRVDFASLPIEQIVARWPDFPAIERSIREQLPDLRIVSKAVDESRAKAIDRDELRRRLQIFRHQWPALKTLLQAQLLAPAEIRQRLIDVGGLSQPHQIGVSQEQLRASYTQAQMIRRRYTIFDLAIETGAFDDCVARLFESDGFWNRMPEHAGG